jgi:hypothetical protein
MFVGFLTLPESPRWLAQKGLKEQAAQVLRSLRESDQNADDELKEILESVPSDAESDPEDEDLVEEDKTEMEYGTLGLNAVEDPPRKHHDESVVHRFIDMVTDPPTRRALVLGAVLRDPAVFNNTIVHYAPLQKCPFDSCLGFCCRLALSSTGTSIFLVDTMGA